MTTLAFPRSGLIAGAGLIVAVATIGFLAQTTFGHHPAEISSKPLPAPVCPLDANLETQPLSKLCPARTVTPQSWGVERIAPKK